MGDMTVFTPDDEPYLGRKSVYQLDTLLTVFIEEQVRIAMWTRTASELSPLQRAASELVPSASSIVLSIRELVRQAYLLSALILTRPLMERAATLSYLIENPSKVRLWEQGWPHKSRPSLKERMASLGDVNGAHNQGDQRLHERIADAIDRYNSVVHGDPAGALHGAVLLADGTAGYTIGKDLKSPARADEVCFETVCWLIVLMARSVQTLSPVTPTGSRAADRSSEEARHRWSSLGRVREARVEPVSGPPSRGTS